ncbi:MAG TPA: EpsI family protein [Gemmatimonadaceae bacterium]|nr:EpsI family protein [Gemmatimonadaceae bacterium]
MNSLIRFAPVVILGIGCALHWTAQNQSAIPIRAPLQSVLNDMPGLASANQSISEQERRVAGMTDYVARVYRRDGVVAFTTFVSYYDRQTQGKSIHSPRNCLPGAGWEIVRGDQQTITVDGASYTVNRYILKNRSAIALAYYWYQGRGRVTANEYVVKWNLLRDAAIHGRSEEALVRIVVPVTGQGAEQLARTGLLPEDLTAQSVAGRLVREVAGVLPAL